MSVKVMTKVWEWSQAEGAELLMMLALADRSDDDGVSYPGIGTVAKKCRISGRSVQRHMKKASERGELKIEVGMGIPTEHGPTNRYRITVNRRGDNLAGVTKAAQNSVNRGDTTMAHDSSVKDNTPEVAISVQAFWFADWFSELVGIPTDATSRRLWADSYDRMLRIDKRTHEQIEAVCKWTRSDSFYSGYLNSPVKLRKRRDGVMNFDDIVSRMRPKTLNGAKPTKPSGLEGIRMVS